MTKRSASRGKMALPSLKSSPMQESFPALKLTPRPRTWLVIPGEKITEGLDGLRDRLKGYFQMGARFAKWRAVIAIGNGIPSRGCIEANAQALAHYAVLCQEAGLVPIVEPEVLMDGDHTLEKCRVTTEEVQLIHPREIFRLAIIVAANALIVMHNHPSGDAMPSEADIRATRDLIRAGQLLKMEVVDPNVA
jgi:fructose-bisphosphate aldolase, class I